MQIIDKSNIEFIQNIKKYKYIYANLILLSLNIPQDLIRIILY